MKLRVLVTATNQYGSSSATTAPVGPSASGAPANTTPPVISGITRRGQVLTVSSTWNPASSNGYQWQRSLDGGTTWISIGSNAPSYTLVSADLGGLIRVTVSASNAFGSSTATSDPVGLVASDPPANSAAPMLTGTTQRTYVLTRLARDLERHRQHVQLPVAALRRRHDRSTNIAGATLARPTRSASPTRATGCARSSPPPTPTAR